MELARASRKSQRCIRSTSDSSLPARLQGNVVEIGDRIRKAAIKQEPVSDTTLLRSVRSRKIKQTGRGGRNGQPLSLILLVEGNTNQAKRKPW